MSNVRAPAVAGTFYEADAARLAGDIDAMLAAGDAGAEVPKAIIAPHAGHVYSGPVAAMVYARLRQARGTITRVVLLGPSHRVGFRGIAATSADTYRTPLGDIPVDTAAIRDIAGCANVGVLDAAHEQEHSLEVHLPFLQRSLGQFSLVPLVIGDASAEDVARVLNILWGGDETLIVISSDLSHYHPYQEAQKIDAATSARILSLASDLRGEEACGCRAINGLTRLARQQGYQIEQVDVRNSGDTAGSRDRVVGYGAYVIVNKKTLPLPYRQRLLQTAREAILHRLTTGDNYQLDLNRFPAALRKPGASFVTLNIHGQLRGCIGSLVAHRPLSVDVANNALAAAFNDPRFSPLTLDEFHLVETHISILSEPAEVTVSGRDELIQLLRPGIDGLIIEEGGHRATYLPSVWEQLPDAATFVAELRRKAGLAHDGWSAATRVFRYTTEEFL